MKIFKGNHSTEKIAFFAGITGMASLIAFPVLALETSYPHSSNSNGLISQRIYTEIERFNNLGVPDNSVNNSSDLNFSEDSSNNRSESDSENLLSSQDRSFIMQAARDGMTEVELGQLAIDRGSSESVKQYGRQMVEEHTRANNQLMQLASQKNVSLPTDIGDENRNLLDRLSTLSGTEFDRTYMSEMVKAHNKAVSLFRLQSQQGQDPELTAWSADTLPRLQQHLAMARQMVADRFVPNGNR